MDSISDIHSQRPIYQRENLDLSWKIVREHGLLYNPKTPSFDLTNITYVDFWGKNGGMSIPNEWRIELDIRHSFWQKITVHELLHIVAGKHTYITGIQQKWKQRHYQWINEGLTEIIWLEIFLRNYDTIKEFREKYKNILWEKIIIAEQTWDELSLFTYTRWCSHTGWYHKWRTERLYETLMHLNYVIIDYLAFLWLRAWKRDFDEIRKKIWSDICDCYFNSDLKWFSQIISPIQRKVPSSLSEIWFSEGETKKIIEWIKCDIRDTFKVPYFLEPFWENLNQLSSIFNSTF